MRCTQHRNGMSLEESISAVDMLETEILAITSLSTDGYSLLI
jgi:hypothetical protein